MPVLAQNPDGRGGRLQEQMMMDWRMGKREKTTTHKIHSVSNTCMMNRTKPALARNSEDSRDGNRDTNAPKLNRRYQDILYCPNQASHPSTSPELLVIIPPLSFPVLTIHRRILNQRRRQLPARPLHTGNLHYEGGDRRATTPERSDEICDNNLYL